MFVNIGKYLLSHRLSIRQIIIYCFSIIFGCERQKVQIKELKLDKQHQTNMTQLSGCALKSYNTDFTLGSFYTN